MERYSFEQLFARADRFEKLASVDEAMQYAEKSLTRIIDMTQNLHTIGTEIEKTGSIDSVGTRTVKVISARTLYELDLLKDYIAEIKKGDYVWSESQHKSVLSPDRQNELNKRNNK